MGAPDSHCRSDGVTRARWCLSVIRLCVGVGFCVTAVSVPNWSRPVSSVLASSVPVSPGREEAVDMRDLVGLWEAHRDFGPEVEGPLTIRSRGGGLVAEIRGFEVMVSRKGDEIDFSLPGQRGSFRGVIDQSDPAAAGDWTHRTIDGWWTQPHSTTNGRAFRTPVRLVATDAGTWQGDVSPRRDDFRLFLAVSLDAEGVAHAFLRNPEQNLGVFLDVDHIERFGDEVHLVGTSFGRGELRVLATGTFDADWDRLSITIPNRGGTYDFRRVDDDPASAFYARERGSLPYVYTEPPMCDDGWQTGNTEDVDVDLMPIRRMIEDEIAAEPHDVHAHYVHSVLIARHGRLVVEEYFHGFSRETPHDIRSAGKSLTSILFGAAMESGLPISVDTPVYATMAVPVASGLDPSKRDAPMLDASVSGESSPGPASYRLPELDPRTRAMTARHLLTMTSGLDCDDSDPGSPGAEDRMQDQEDQPDWYRYTLEVPMAHAPGEHAAYCSASSNLLGAVLAKATGQKLERLINELVAKPLQFDTYHLSLQPTGEPYMGGGVFLCPRDFLKLGQLMLDHGVWNGRRVVSPEWVRESTSAQVRIGDREYGYLWWVRDYSCGERRVRAFFAAGNGGNIVVVVPELDLVVGFTGGNYSDRVLYKSQDVLIPEYVLPAMLSSESSR